MEQSHITEAELDAALVEYRWALGDALDEVGSDGSRDAVIARAREILGEEAPDEHEVIVAFAEGDAGDRVWSLEEEIIDDEETVPSGDTESDSDSDDD